MPGRAEELHLEYDLVISIGEFFDEAIYFASVGYDDAHRANLAAASSPVEESDETVEKKQPGRTHQPIDEDWAVSRSGQIGEASG